MSLKDWKNKELNENLNNRWGFDMDLSKLNEGFGTGPMDPMGGESSMEMDPPMSNDETNVIQMCVDQKVAQGVPLEVAGPECEKEIAEWTRLTGRPPEKYYIGTTPGENPEFSNLLDTEEWRDPRIPPGKPMMENKRRRKKVLKENKTIRVRIKR